MLVQYLRDSKKKPYGVIVALSPGEIGWSLCGPKDTFNKDLGKRIAAGRAKKYANRDISELVYVGGGLPRKRAFQVVFYLERMKQRAEKYFKIPSEQFDLESNPREMYSQYNK